MITTLENFIIYRSCYSPTSCIPLEVYATTIYYIVKCISFFKKSDKGMFDYFTCTKL